MNGYSALMLGGASTSFHSSLPLANNSVIFHAADLCKRPEEQSYQPCWGDPLAHAQHPIDLLDAEPMQNVGHQGLKTHILDACNVFSPLEIVRGPVFSAFSRIVNNCGVWVSSLIYEGATSYYARYCNMSVSFYL